MAHGQDSRRFAVEAVGGDVTAIAEVDEPLPKLRVHVTDRAADVRLMCELARPLGSLGRPGERRWYL